MTLEMFGSAHIHLFFNVKQSCIIWVLNESSSKSALELFLSSGDTIEVIDHLHLNRMIAHLGQNNDEQQICHGCK